MNPIRLALAELRRLTARALPARRHRARRHPDALRRALPLRQPRPVCRPAAGARRRGGEDTGTTLGERGEAGRRGQVADQLVDSRVVRLAPGHPCRGPPGCRGRPLLLRVLVPRGFSADLASQAEFTPRRAARRARDQRRQQLPAHDHGQHRDRAGHRLGRLAGQPDGGRTGSSSASARSTTSSARPSTGASSSRRASSRPTAARPGLDGCGRARVAGCTTWRRRGHGAPRGRRAGVAGRRPADVGRRPARLRSRRPSSSARRSPARPDPTACRRRPQVADGNARSRRSGNRVAGGLDLAATMTSRPSAPACSTSCAPPGSTTPRCGGRRAASTRVDGRPHRRRPDPDGLRAARPRCRRGPTRSPPVPGALADATPALTDGISRAATGARELRDGRRPRDRPRHARRRAARAPDGGQRAASAVHSLAAGVADLSGGARASSTRGAAEPADSSRRAATRCPTPARTQRKAMAQTLGDPGRRNVGSHGLRRHVRRRARSALPQPRPVDRRLRAVPARASRCPRARPGHQPASLRTALGGWLAPAALGVGPDRRAVPVVSRRSASGSRHPVLTVLFLGFVSMTFVAILHALAARLGAVGQVPRTRLHGDPARQRGGHVPVADAARDHSRRSTTSSADDATPSTGSGGSCTAADSGRCSGDQAVLAAYLVGALAVSTVAARRWRVWTPARIRPELGLWTAPAPVASGLTTLRSGACSGYEQLAAR